MEKLRTLDLFSGIGGFSLGLDSTGYFETVAFCEIEEFPCKVLNKHWPNVPIYNDVRELSYEKLQADGIISRRRGIDVICGGYPCQPFSVAGRQKGEEDPRHLWPEYFRLIRELRPSYVIGENVGGHIRLGLDSVLEDLDSENYTVRCFSVGLRFPTPRASDVEGGIVEDVELNNGSFSRRNKKGERWGVKLRDAANYLDKKEKEEPSLFPTPQAADHLANQSETLEAWEKRAEKKKEEGINLQFALRHAVQMWPTPQAMDGMRSGQIRKREELSEAALRGGCSNLREAVHDPKYLEQNIWPTPMSRDWKDSVNSVPPSVGKTRGYTLGMKVASEREQMLPTPTARDWKSGEASENTHQRNSRPLNEKVIRENKAQQKKSEEKLHLNPTWVEGMMGFPHGWTDLGNEESPE